MLIRALVILVAICVIWRWAFGQWPWQAMSTRSAKQQSLHKARKLLAVEEGASAEQIRAAHKRVLAKVHPDRGGSSTKVHEANAARDLLLAELPDLGAGVTIDQDDSDTKGSQD